MMSFVAMIPELLTNYGPWGIIFILTVAILCFLRIMIDEDLSAMWRARYFKMSYKITGKSKAEKKYIENDICGKINLARRKMPFGAENIPKAIKMEWFAGMAGETAQIKENEIIVRLDPFESQNKNITLVANALVKQTALVGIRHVVEGPLEASIDLNLVKTLLSEIGNRKVLDWYFRNEYSPNVHKSEELREWNNKIVEIDEKGLFTRLLLVELDDYSKRVVGKPATTEMFDEIKLLVDFLYNMSIRGLGSVGPLDISTQNIKIAIILAGNTRKILAGIDNYLTAFAHNVEKQFTSIYVIVWDKDALGTVDPSAYEKFIEMTKTLDSSIEITFKIPKHYELDYVCIDHKGNRRKAKITRYVP